MSPSPAMALAPPAGRGLGEGWSRARPCAMRFSQDPRMDIGGAPPPRRPSPNPLPTTWGEGAERLA